MAPNSSSRDIVLVVQRTLILLIGTGLVLGIFGGIYWYMRLRPDRFIDVRNQVLQGRSVLIKRVTLPKPGFVVVRVDEGYPSAGAVYALSGKLEAGTHKDVQLAFFRDEWLQAQDSNALVAMVFPDVDGDGFLTEFDSDPMLDEMGNPIERTFRITQEVQPATMTCDAEVTEEFNGPDLDLEVWEPLFVTDLEDDALILPIKYGQNTRLPTKKLLTGDFDVTATYRSFSVTPMADPTFTRLTAYSGPYEHVLAATWYQDESGSYIDGTINSVVGPTRFPVSADASVTLHLRRVGTTAEISVLLDGEETVIHRSDDASTNPVYIGLHIEDMGGPFEQSVALIDAVHISCP